MLRRFGHLNTQNHHATVQQTCCARGSSFWSPVSPVAEGALYSVIWTLGTDLSCGISDTAWKELLVHSLSSVKDNWDNLSTWGIPLSTWNQDPAFCASSRARVRNQFRVWAC